MRVVLSVLMFFAPVLFAASSMNLKLDAVSLADALRIVASQAHLNVMISPDVQGVANVALNHAGPENVFDSLLLAHHLGKIQIGNIWFVAPHERLIQSMEEQRQQQLAGQGPFVTQSWLIRYANAEEVMKLIQAQLHSSLAQAVTDIGQVSFDARTNMVIMRDTPERIAIARRLVRKLDVPVQQVLIETRLVSVDIDAERSLGLEFATHHEVKADNTAMQSVQPGRVVVTIAKLADSSQLDVTLSALEQQGRAELISSPSLFANSQQEASIEAGEEVPYQEVSRSGGTAAAFKKAVLGLRVKPQVLPDKRVMLSLQINQDRPSSHVIGGVPAISTRQIKTSVLLKDGETAILGGIYEINQEKSRVSLPFLGKVPVIGLLFTHNTIRKNKRELLVFVTPRIKTA